jgi:hypothetical protein
VPFSQLLTYEFVLRKRSCELLREDGAMAVAESLQKATHDTELRELHFITPLLSHAHDYSSISTPHIPLAHSLPPPPPVPERFEPFRANYGGGKGGGWGKGGGRGGGAKGRGKQPYWKGQEHLRKAPGTLAGKATNGMEICFKWNAGKDSDPCDGKCNRLHICRVSGCGLKHKAFECPLLDATTKAKLQTQRSQ